MENLGTIIKVNGPVVRARGMRAFGMREMVRVGAAGLWGEIIRMEGAEALIQVYEDTQGLRLGEPVSGTGEALSVSLGPGLIGNIFDGIGRPLGALLQREGAMLSRGIQVPMLEPDTAWEFRPASGRGDTVTGGVLLGTV